MNSIKLKKLRIFRFVEDVRDRRATARDGEAVLVCTLLLMLLEYKLSERAIEHLHEFFDYALEGRYSRLNGKGEAEETLPESEEKEKARLKSLFEKLKQLPQMLDAFVEKDGED